MAQKRMFDKAIIETDKFMDMPLSAKALYFLLGMEADDQGFVSPRKVMRVHGGADDDLKILIAKNLVIHFESGVVVVTDWNQNNYLDKNRLRPTQYQDEAKKLLLTPQGKYELNNGLTSIEEKRGEYLSETEVSRETILPQLKAGEILIGGKVMQTADQTADGEVRPLSRGKSPKYPNAREIYKIFQEFGFPYPANWNINTAYLKAGENLFKERKEDGVRRALKFYNDNKADSFCPVISTPWDLDAKWEKLLDFKEKKDADTE